MRLFVLRALLLAICGFFVSPVIAQESAKRRVVALDSGSAQLLKACCPNTDFESLILAETDSYQAINRRARSMRDASCLIYRGDQLSPASLLFLERLVAQGVPAIDLAAYASEQGSFGPRSRPPSRRFDAAVRGEYRVSKQSSFVISLVIDQFRKISLDYEENSLCRNK